MREWHYGTVPQGAKKAPIGMKWCGLCGETKPLSEFHHATRRRAGKLVRQPHSECKGCAAERKKR